MTQTQVLLLGLFYFFLYVWSSKRGWSPRFLQATSIIMWSISEVRLGFLQPSKQCQILSTYLVIVPVKLMGKWFIFSVFVMLDICQPRIVKSDVTFPLLSYSLQLFFMCLMQPTFKYIRTLSGCKSRLKQGLSCGLLSFFYSLNINYIPI